MSENIGIAGFGEILHEKCHKPIARIGADGGLQVECPRRGCRERVSLKSWGRLDVLRQSIDLILSGQVSPASVIALADPLAPYRQIEGLTVFGPQEWEQKAMIGPNGENPLGLSSGWCPQVPLPLDWTPELLRCCVKWGQLPENNCVPVLVLCLSKAGENIVSLANTYNWWGQNGIIHHGIQYSDWFIGRKDCSWGVESVVPEATWKLIWFNFPAWTIKKNAADQLEIARSYGLAVSDVKTAVLVLDLLRINGQKFLTNVSARASTVYDGDPLHVYSYADGVNANRSWHAGNANPWLGVVLEGVPNDLPLGS